MIIIACQHRHIRQNDFHDLLPREYIYLQNKFILYFDAFYEQTFCDFREFHYSRISKPKSHKLSVIRKTSYCSLSEGFDYCQNYTVFAQICKIQETQMHCNNFTPRDILFIISNKSMVKHNLHLSKPLLIRRIWLRHSIKCKIFTIKRNSAQYQFEQNLGTNAP